MRYIGKLNKEIYSCVTKEIASSEVIITETQIRHIRERHPGDYENFMVFMENIIADPDYILEANRPDTAFILKAITQNGLKFQLILRLKTSRDPENYQNSVITFLKIDQRKWEKYLRNKTILYKRE